MATPRWDGRERTARKYDNARFSTITPAKGEWKMPGVWLSIGRPKRPSSPIHQVNDKVESSE